MLDELKQSGSVKIQADTEQGRLFFPAKGKADIYGEGRVYRTCAYCRVSTDSDMQLSSFELQTEHYQSLAGKHPNWDLRRIYADEGISGTSLKNRNQFNEMLEACWRGEYDLILTKSVSRFARNLVDCISLVRRLKNHNPPIGVFFETDNLFTLSEDSELKLSLLATFAQEESVKKSESMIWSLQERFKTERLLMPDCFGYTREKDAVGRYVKGAKLQVVEEEAQIVRFVYDAFLAGYPLQAIAEILTDIGIPTKSGSREWSVGSIRYILSNERYCGSVLTWKTFTADIFEHKKRRNRQDRDQYLYTNEHEAIISVEKFEAVQTLLENKKHHLQGGLPTMHVIDEGIFRGYVPVNHHWINDDPYAYYAASNSVERAAQSRRLRRSYFSAFKLDGYQIVRGQFMMYRPECPCITVTDQHISFNVECQRKFSDVGHIQLLVHPTERKIAIRPCEEQDAYSIRWRLGVDRPLGSKVINCQYFSTTLYKIMEWNPEYQYKICGTWATQGKEQIIIFDLSNAMPIATVEERTEGETARKRKIALCAEEWGDSFGTEFYVFNIRNSFYYLPTKKEWKAKTKSHAVPVPGQIQLLSEEELRMNIEDLRAKVGASYGE